jgi:hypothetical protein
MRITTAFHTSRAASQIFRKVSLRSLTASLLAHMEWKLSLRSNCLLPLPLLPLPLPLPLLLLLLLLLLMLMLMVVWGQDGRSSPRAQCCGNQAPRRLSLPLYSP